MNITAAFSTGKIIRDAQIAPECLRLKVAEGIIIENAAAAIDQLAETMSQGASKPLPINNAMQFAV